MAGAWHIVCNESAGQGQAVTLLKQVQERLDAHEITYQIHQTASPGDGTRIAEAIGESDTAITLVILGGDGTVGEVVNGLSRSISSAKIAVIPAGTANALYHSLFTSVSASDDYDRFLSLDSALANAPKTAALSSMEVVASDGSMQPSKGIVVTSTALHAHILETASSPEMRKQYPGVERFRKSAEMHFGTVYSAKVTLLPHIEGVKRWSPKSHAWEVVSQEKVVIEDGFTYFISALTDRFEAKFVIAPQSAARDRPASALDVLLVRAKRDGQDAATLLNILNSAYQDGKHAAMSEVEYYRVSGYDWQPVSLTRSQGTAS